MDIEQLYQIKSPKLCNLSFASPDKRKKAGSSFKLRLPKQTKLEKITNKIVNQKLKQQLSPTTKDQNQSDFLKKSQDIQREWSINSKQYKKSDILENSVDLTIKKGKLKGKKPSKVKNNIDKWFLNNTRQTITNISRVNIRNAQYQNKNETFTLRKIRSFNRQRNTSFSRSYPDTPFESSQRKIKRQYQNIKSQKNENEVLHTEGEIPKHLFKKEKDFNQYVDKLSNYAYDTKMVYKEQGSQQNKNESKLQKRPYSATQNYKKGNTFISPKSTSSHSNKHFLLNHGPQSKQDLNEIFKTKINEQKKEQIIRKGSIRYLDFMDNPFNRYQRQKYLQILQEMQNSYNVSILWELFLIYDRDKDGIVTKEDIKKTIFYMENRVIEEKEVQAIMDILDVDKSGGVNFDEFQNILLINNKT